MPFVSAQVTVSATVATPLLGARFKNLAGTLADPIPITLTNTDATNNVYIGGADVSATNGFLLLHGATLQLSHAGPATGGPFALASAGTPVVGVLAARQ